MEGFEENDLPECNDEENDEEEGEDDEDDDDDDDDDDEEEEEEEEELLEGDDRRFETLRKSMFSASSPVKNSSSLIQIGAKLCRARFELRVGLAAESDSTLLLLPTAGALVQLSRTSERPLSPSVNDEVGTRAEVPVFALLLERTAASTTASGTAAVPLSPAYEDARS